jgi:hypothetical protein
MTDSEQTPLIALDAALAFTPADLLANRAGTLGDGQRARLQKAERRAWMIVIALGVGIAVSAATLLYAGSVNESPPLNLVGVSLTVVNAVVLAVGVGMRLRARDDLATGGVETLTGTVRRVVRVQRRIVTYIVAIETKTGEARFNVPRDVFNAFAEGARYRLYHTARARTLIAAERA